MARVLVDSNVIIDIARADPTWSSWSASALAAYEAPMANSMVFAELSYTHSSASEVSDLLLDLKINFSDLPREALFLAAQAYKTYRQRGGTKTAPLPDFFIGAHAEVLGIPLLTRAASRYRTYFPDVELITP